MAIEKPKRGAKPRGAMGAAKGGTPDMGPTPPFEAEGIDIPSDVSADIPAAPTSDIPEEVDVFLEGRGERLRGRFSSIPHFTLTIGNRAVRGAEWGGKWYVEAMHRRVFMISDVHNIPWERKGSADAVGKLFVIDEEQIMLGDGLSVVVGKSGGGKTMLLNLVMKAQAENGGDVAYINATEPVPESNNDMAVMLLGIADAIINNKRNVLLFDSFKGPLFMTPGTAGKGGISRTFFQDLSDLSSLMGRYRIAGIGAVNFLTRDNSVAEEVTESLVGSTVGVFEVRAVSSTVGGDSVTYRYFARNYLTGERPTTEMSIAKPEFAAVNLSSGKAIPVTEAAVMSVVRDAFNAPDLEASTIPGTSITKALIRGNRN